MDSTVIGCPWLSVVADVVSLCINPPTTVNGSEVTEDVAGIVEEGTLTAVVVPESPPCPMTGGWVIDVDIAGVYVVEARIEVLAGVVIGAGIAGDMTAVPVSAGKVEANAVGASITSCA